LILIKCSLPFSKAPFYSPSFSPIIINIFISFVFLVFSTRNGLPSPIKDFA